MSLQEVLTKVKPKAYFGKKEHEKENKRRFFANKGYYYFHPDIVRSESERLLCEQRKQCTTFIPMDDTGIFFRREESQIVDFLLFLVRPSTTVPGAFVLSHESPNGSFKHFLIPTDTSRMRMTFLHNLDGRAIPYENLTSFIQQYFIASGYPGVGVKSSDFETMKKLDVFVEGRPSMPNQKKIIESFGTVCLHEDDIVEVPNQLYCVTDLDELVVADVHNNMQTNPL